MVKVSVFVNLFFNSFNSSLNFKSCLLKNLLNSFNFSLAALIRFCLSRFRCISSTSLITSRTFSLIKVSISFRKILAEQILKLQQQSGQVLDGVPILISGMASSSIGMMELPYKELPFLANGSDLLTHFIESWGDFNQNMIIISGVRSSDDVMRGEEAILVGCDVETSEAAQLFILPGTHSKHITVKNGVVSDFKTYMTGEIFNLLSNDSILSGSIEKGNINKQGDSFFIKGVTDSIETNFLQSIFHVRTNQLFGKLNRKENYHYLSGSVVGAELKHLKQNDYSGITIVADEILSGLYLQALNSLGLHKNLNHINADKALVKGQSAILIHHINK